MKLESCNPISHHVRVILCSPTQPTSSDTKWALASLVDVRPGDDVLVQQAEVERRHIGVVVRDEDEHRAVDERRGDARVGAGDGVVVEDVACGLVRVRALAADALQLGVGRVQLRYPRGVLSSASSAAPNEKQGKKALTLALPAAVVVV